MPRETKTGVGRRASGVDTSGRRDAPLTTHDSRLTTLRRLARLWRDIFGMPDYERYLEHRRCHHPGEPVLSRGEHFKQQVEGRYAGGGGRCC